MAEVDREMGRGRDVEDSKEANEHEKAFFGEAYQ